MNVSGISQQKWRDILAQQITNFNEMEWFCAQEFKSWQKAREGFISHFINPNTKALKLEELMNAKQRNEESTQEYCDRFEYLINQAQAIDSVYLVNIFRSGLRNKKIIDELRRKETFNDPYLTVRRIIDETMFLEAQLARDREQ